MGGEWGGWLCCKGEGVWKLEISILKEKVLLKIAELQYAFVALRSKYEEEKIRVDGLNCDESEQKVKEAREELAEVMKKKNQAQTKVRFQIWF